MSRTLRKAISIKRSTVTLALRLESDRSADWIYYDRGIAYSAKGDYRRAIDDYTQAIGVHP